MEVSEAEPKLASGIGPRGNDECQIDPAACGVFAPALLALHRRTGHTVVQRSGHRLADRPARLASLTPSKPCAVPPAIRRRGTA
ncbi:DUF6086 family protein [Streptomyces sp. NPDC052721]|uniref:DUF6086 family protein n=1 Tax=Streptomyces sp. NPDC052721 TaxID=3154955 RepID=UPI00341EF160